MAQLQVTPESFKELAHVLGKKPSITLTNNTLLELTLEELSLPIGFFTDVANSIPLSIRTNVKLKEASLHNDHLNQPILLKELKATLYAPKGVDEVRIDLQSEASQNDVPIQLALSGSLPKPTHVSQIRSLIHHAIQWNVEAKEVPFSLIENFLEIKDHQLMNSLGDFFSIKLQMSSHEGNSPIFFSFKSNLMSMQARGEIQPHHRLLLTTPIQIEYEMPSTLLSSVDTLHPNWLKLNPTLPLKISVAPFAISLDTSIDTLPPLTAQVELRQINGMWEKPLNITMDVNLTNLVKLDAFIKMQIEGDQIKGLLTSHIKNTSPSKDFVWFSADYVDIHAEQFPLSFLSLFKEWDIHLKNKAEALIGHIFDGDITFQKTGMNGLLKADINGQNGKYFIDGQLKQNIFTLNQPFKADIQVTPELAKHVLKDLMPSLGEMERSEKPVALMISPIGFSLPIDAVSMQQIQIGEAAVDFGKVIFNGHGELGSFLELFKVAPHDDLTIWFTPIYMQMADGILQVKRTDLLMMEEYHLAAWGKIDFPNDKVRLIAGLTGSALEKALNISLDKDYMMQLPIKGKVGEAAIDKKKATSRFTALIAQDKGPHGKLFGTFLNLTDGTYSEEKPPEPTTSPYPWEQMMKEKHKARPKSKHKKDTNLPPAVIAKFKDLFK